MDNDRSLERMQHAPQKVLRARMLRLVED